MDDAPLKFADPPGSETELRYYPWVVIRFRCIYCARQADARTAACAARYGHKMPVGYLVQQFRKGCQWSD